MEKVGNKAAVSERAAVTPSLDGGCNEVETRPLADSCTLAEAQRRARREREPAGHSREITSRFIVTVPSAAGTPMMNPYSAQDLDEVRQILWEQGDNAQRCYVGDREGPDGPQRVSLEGLLPRV